MKINNLTGLEISKSEYEKLREDVVNLLEKQSREDFVDDIIEYFSLEKLETMIEKNIDLVDMDRWVAMEKLVKCDLKWDEAIGIINKMWEYDIEILELVDL